MKLIFQTVLIGVLTLLSLQAFGQERDLERADKKFNQYAFIDAQKIYLKVAEEGYASADLFEKLGDSYYFNADYEEAKRWYDRLVNEFPTQVSAEYYFRYAQTLRSIKEYKKADAMMDQFNALANNDSRGVLFDGDRDYLKEITYRKSTYELQKLRRLNSRFSDFAPMIYENRLIFSSSRDTGSAGKRIYKWNNQPFLDLFQAAIDPKGEPGKVSSFGGDLNTKFHESTTAFTKDGKTMYFTRNNYLDGKLKEDNEGTNRLKIYKATKKGSGWSDPVELPFNSDEFSVAHPSLNAANDRLYFASDMPGTRGLSDIWYVSVDASGKYGKPVNLGPSINTEGRESFPFMSKKGNLYFASNGHPGLGGLDVYVSTYSGDGERSKVINLGEPINSSDDDFTFIVDDDALSGYFASNRRGGRGSDDIYRFVQIEDPACDVVIQGAITDLDSGEILPDTQVVLLDLEGNELSSTTSTAEGIYVLNAVCDTRYVIRASKTEYTTAEKIVLTPEQSATIDQPIALEKRLKTVREGDDLGQILDLNPIYFDFDRFNIRRDAAEELEKIVAAMKEFPNLKIDVRSHTDSRGNDSYNRSLSDKRAKATVNWMINRGIDANRLSGQGYGESQPVNNCTNGADCTEAEFQLNRRSEFIVLSNEDQ
ncbi:OmpA family protein [Croceiramulus getboli]|nr:OmpA family protein [Flavobacteriaceae bacterium YJPT1-3]